MNIIEYNYDASPGFGINFKAKSFLCETSKFLYIISPARFDAEMIKKIKFYSKEIIVIAPNNFHNIGLSLMRKHFPSAKIYGPKRSAKQSGIKLLNIKDLPEDSDFKGILIEGNKSLSETVFIHAPTKRLIVTDILFNMHNEMNLTSTILFKLYGTYKKLGQSILLRLTANDKNLFIKSLKSLVELEFEKVLLNHGDHISKEEFKKFILNLN
jgi:hypothetical protein